MPNANTIPTLLISLLIHFCVKRKRKRKTTGLFYHNRTNWKLKLSLHSSNLDCNLCVFQSKSVWYNKRQCQPPIAPLLVRTIKQSWFNCMQLFKEGEKEEKTAGEGVHTTWLQTMEPVIVKSLWVQLSLLVWLFVISSSLLEPLPSWPSAPQLVCCPASCAQVHRLIALGSTASYSPEPAPEPLSSSTVSPYVEHEPTCQVWLIPEERLLQKSSRDVTKALNFVQISTWWEGSYFGNTSQMQRTTWTTWTTLLAWPSKHSSEDDNNKEPQMDPSGTLLY